MGRLNRLMSLASVIFLAAVPLNAMSEEGEAGTELDFMSLGAGARPAGLGGAFVGISDDANCVYWNVAGMALVIAPQATGMHTDLDMGTVFDYVAAVAPLRNPFGPNSGPSPNSIGFSVVRVSTGDILLTEEGSDTLPGGEYKEIVYKGTAQFRASTYSLAYSRRFTSALTVGVSGKIIDMTLLDHNGTGYGLDLGILYSPLKGQRWLDDISLGLSIQDVNATEIKWTTDYKEKISPNVRLGVAYKLFADRNFTDWIPREGITLAGSVDQQIKEARQERWHKPQYHLGVEWKLMGVVPVRAGYDYGQFTSGIGFVSRHVRVDYAYVSHQELKTTHRVAITLTM